MESVNLATMKFSKKFPQIPFDRSTLQRFTGSFPRSNFRTRAVGATDRVARPSPSRARSRTTTPTRSPAAISFPNVRTPPPSSRMIIFLLFSFFLIWSTGNKSKLHYLHRKVKNYQSVWQKRFSKLKNKMVDLSENLAAITLVWFHSNSFEQKISHLFLTL